LRFEGSFEYAIDVDSSLDIYNEEIPILLIQPYIENAIIHGLVPKKEGTKEMNVRFTNFDKYIQCTITDSGIGRKASYKLNEGKRSYRKSMGMSLTQKRLELINKNKEAINSYVEVIDLGNDVGDSNGTKVTIKIFKN